MDQPRISPDVTVFTEIVTIRLSSAVYFLSSFRLNLLFQAWQLNTKAFITVEAAVKVTIKIQTHEGNLAR